MFGLVRKGVAIGEIDPAPRHARRDARRLVILARTFRLQRPARRDEPPAQRLERGSRASASAETSGLASPRSA